MLLTNEDTLIRLHVARGIAGGPRQAGRIIDDMTFADRVDDSTMRCWTERAGFGMSPLDRELWRQSERGL